MVTIFFDDGGVINDNRRRGPKWWKLVGEFFSPRYGGDPKDWAAANVNAVEEEMKLFGSIEEQAVPVINGKMYRKRDIMWMTNMFDTMGIPLPTEDEMIRVARQAQRWIMPQANAPFEGIVDAIGKLGTCYGPLYTASNERSNELRGYLTGLDLIEHFATLYGPDLVGLLKSTADYYHRIFDEVGIDPTDAIIIEDRPEIIEVIESTGATAVQSRQDGKRDPACRYHFDHADQLVGLVGDIVQRMQPL